MDRERSQTVDGGEGLRRGVSRNQPSRERQTGRRHPRPSISERTVQLFKEEGEDGARHDILDNSEIEAFVEQILAQVNFPRTNEIYN